MLTSNNQITLKQTDSMILQLLSFTFTMNWYSFEAKHGDGRRTVKFNPRPIETGQNQGCTAYKYIWWVSDEYF